MGWWDWEIGEALGRPGGPWPFPQPLCSRCPLPGPPGAHTRLLTCAPRRPGQGTPRGERPGKRTLATVLNPGGFCSRPAAGGPGWRQTLPRPPQTRSGSGGPEPALWSVLLPFLVPEGPGRTAWCGPSRGGVPLRAGGRGHRASASGTFSREPASAPPSGGCFPPQGPAPTQAGTRRLTHASTCVNTRMHTCPPVRKCDSHRTCTPTHRRHL